MAPTSDDDAARNCFILLEQLYDNNTLVGDAYLSVLSFCRKLRDFEKVEVEGKSYGKPMLWIGIYIAVASFFCILPMAADLFHGFRNRKLWFPSKYFTLNTASITVITIAMKLPVDLNSRMPGYVDEFAKMGSMAFMCTMMANLMPSLASMDNRELFANVAGMVILVITIVVNVLIQMETGLLDKYFIGYVYISAMLSLLVLLVSSALTIPPSKRILELKYQVVHKKTSNTRMPTVEELTQYVRKYWVMAGTCSPQFVMITTPLCSAVGVICIGTTILHYFIFLVVFIIDHEDRNYLDYHSDYKWSMLVIYIIQTIGIGLGTIAPVFRCFSALSFKLSIKWIKKHIKVYEVEKYWTQKLLEWKEISLAFPLGGHLSKVIIYNLYNLILNLCIICQKVIVVSCKIIGLVPLGTVIIGVFCVYCGKSLKAKLFSRPISSNRETIPVEQNDSNQDIGNYVLQLQDEMELGTRTVKSISNSANRSIQKAEKEVPNDLLKLILKNTGFEGVVNFDSDNIQPLICDKFPNSWSLPIVTLTCIAISLPNVSQESVDSLFNSVCEGLSYTLLVEESLNSVGEYVNIHRATKALWREVEVSYRWLGNTLQRNAFRDRNLKETLKWFSDKAEEIVVEMNKRGNEELFDNSHDKMIVVDSMYRVTQTIMVNYPNHIQHNREEQLFGVLSGMIVDIALACFTNLPRVIAMKCHDDAIEKREASVRAAAKLLGSTKKILEKLHACEVPRLDPEQMAFIDAWRVHFKQSIP
ncbi:hypothetical protein OSB04_022572 [Centaurea solstitialis]|uniref:Uncharacterized protein n=1 Tax=Centaurea solstitialis TaxID=347529 RepID=A0AA38SY12_9ASTR|nr:hypothetical protein OSB04_022572 [Centaurea solstitialis]